jgi:hypothetical protein
MAPAHLPAMEAAAWLQKSASTLSWAMKTKRQGDTA